MRAIATLLLLLFLALTVVLAFERFAPVHFHVWFLQQGSYISLSITFVSIFWKEVDKETRLISADPRKYVAGCSTVIAGVIRVLADALHPKDAQPHHSIGFLDGLGTLATTLVLLIYLLFWAIAVAPLLYFIILVTGAPARSGLKHKDQGLLQKENSVDDLASFWSKPVGSTYAVTALFIWGLKSLLGL